METIVVSTTETAVLTTETSSTVVSDNDVVTTIVTGLMGPPGATMLAGLDDIDFDSLSAGATLVYDTAINKWVATRILDQQIIECGQY